MSQTHKNLVALLKGRASRVVSNNTRVIRNPDGSVALRLHQTDILTARPDGCVVVNSGGWRTTTTKDRLNNFLADGLHLWQESGIWKWSQRKRDGQVLPEAPAPRVFSDGDVIGVRGGLVTSATSSAVRKAKELARQVNDYARLCAALVPMKPPSGGDCWYCHMVAAVPGEKPQPVQAKLHCARGEQPPTLQRTLGDASGNHEHLLSHMAEGYVVPSLVMHALREAGANDFVLHCAFSQQAGVGHAFARDRVLRSVRRYLKRRLSLAGN